MNKLRFKWFKFKNSYKWVMFKFTVKRWIEERLVFKVDNNWRKYKYVLFGGHFTSSVSYSTLEITGLMQLLKLSLSQIDKIIRDSGYTSFLMEQREYCFVFYFFTHNITIGIKGKEKLANDYLRSWLLKDLKKRSEGLFYENIHSR